MCYKLKEKKSQFRGIFWAWMEWVWLDNIALHIVPSQRRLLAKHRFSLNVTRLLPLLSPSASLRWATPQITFTFQALTEMLRWCVPFPNSRLTCSSVSPNSLHSCHRNCLSTSWSYYSFQGQWFGCFVTTVTASPNSDCSMRLVALIQLWLC